MSLTRLAWPLAALAALALGLFGGRLLPPSPGEGSADVRFAREMNAHHQQAVEMALALRERTRDETLRPLTLDIVLTQTNQMGRMQAWLESWGASLFSREPLMGGKPEAMGMATRAQVNSLSTLPVSDAEVRFLQLMIRHHQGGVMMAEDALKRASQPGVRDLASAIVRSQSTEIKAMRDQLEERGAEQPEPLAPMNMGHEGMK